MKFNTIIARILLSVGLAILAVSIYATVFHAEFLSSWDDTVYVTENLLLKEPNIYKIFTTPFDGSYQPMIILSLALDYALWGLNPFGYHLTNTALHILNSLLVYLFLLKLLSRHEKAANGSIELMAAFGAFVFASHPVNVESVAWITERKNVLSMFFFLLAFNSYLEYKESLKRLHYDLTLLIFFLAILSKSAVVVFPILMILYDYTFTWEISHGVWLLLREKIPFLLLSGVAAILQIVSHANIGFIHKHPGSDPVFTFYTMLKGINVYIRNSFFPVNLSGAYNLPVSTSIIDPLVLLSLSAILMILALTLYLRKNDKLLFYAILLFFVPLLPVSNIVKISIFIADRYLYIPSIGFSLLMCVTLHRIYSLILTRTKFVQAFPICLLIAVFIVYEYSLIAIKRGGVWQDSATFWEDNVRKNPEHAFAHYILAGLYTDRERARYSDALTHSMKALELLPNEKSMLYQRAIIFIMTGDYKRAERDLERINRLDPNYPMVYYGFGLLYTSQGRFDDANKAWNNFLALYKPTPNLGNSWIELAKNQIQKYKKIEVSPKVR